MKPEIVIATYRPHEGKSEDLRNLLRQHVLTLQELELATNRVPIIARARDGSFIEVFEWRSKEAASEAHHHPAVAAIWEKMAKVGKFVTLDSLEESRGEFPHFDPVAIG